MASGEQVAAFALTEPSAGSDAAAIQTRAEPKSDGSGYTLNGSKIWITNGGFADVFTVFARMSPVDSAQKPKITAFIVERGMGVKNGPPEHKLGIRGSSTTEVVLRRRARAEQERARRSGARLQGRDGGAELGALGARGRLGGGVQAPIKMAVDRVQERKAFGRPIGEFGLIKDKIAAMMADTFAIESMTYLTAGLVDSKVADYSLESAICKVYAF